MDDVNYGWCPSIMDPTHLGGWLTSKTNLNYFLGFLKGEDCFVVYPLAPIGGKINQCHCGDLRTFVTICTDFREGPKKPSAMERVASSAPWLDYKVGCSESIFE